MIIINNPKIQPRHWIHYECQMFKDITLNELIKKCFQSNNQRDSSIQKTENFLNSEQYE